MSPAPETLGRPSNASSLSSLSISTILSRPPRTPLDSPGPFSADRRVTSFIRRNFSGGPRPAPFRTTGTRETEETGSTQALLISALETRRRRIEELRNQSAQTNIATTIADQWRRRQEGTSPTLREGRPRSSSTGPTTPVNQTLRLFDNDSDDTDSDDDDPDNKFSSTYIRQTPPPTFLTPNTSPSTTATSPTTNDDESSRNAYTLSCKFCANVLTRRGMRARLVADARIHIWSTDEKPNVKLVGHRYATTTCQCQLIDIACAHCETVVGYHIAGSEPCDTCSRSNHNAHYHLLRTNQIIGVQNLNMEGIPMTWADIPLRNKP